VYFSKNQVTENPFITFTINFYFNNWKKFAHKKKAYHAVVACAGMIYGVKRDMTHGMHSHSFLGFPQ
jgi:hypothetical protein